MSPDGTARNAAPQAVPTARRAGRAEAHVDGSVLTLSLPQAVAPVLWRCDLANSGQMVLTLATQDGMWQLLSRQGDSAHHAIIASFHARADAEEALEVAAEGLRRGSKSTTAAAAPAPTQAAPAPRGTGLPLAVLGGAGLIALAIVASLSLRGESAAPVAAAPAAESIQPVLPVAPTQAASPATPPGTLPPAPRNAPPPPPPRQVDTGQLPLDAPLPPPPVARPADGIMGADELFSARPPAPGGNPFAAVSADELLDPPAAETPAEPAPAAPATGSAPPTAVSPALSGAAAEPPAPVPATGATPPTALSPALSGTAPAQPPAVPAAPLGQARQDRPEGVPLSADELFGAPQ